MSGAVRVGSIQQVTGGPADAHWRWSITVLNLAPGEGPTYGVEASRDDAMRAFSTAWRAWLARADFVEATAAL
jgi:hypothetical protein